MIFTCNRQSIPAVISEFPEAIDCKTDIATDDSIPIRYRSSDRCKAQTGKNQQQRGYLQLSRQHLSVRFTAGFAATRGNSKPCAELVCSEPDIVDIQTVFNICVVVLAENPLNGVMPCIKPQVI